MASGGRAESLHARRGRRRRVLGQGWDLDPARGGSGHHPARRVQRRSGRCAGRRRGVRRLRHHGARAELGRLRRCRRGRQGGRGAGGRAGRRPVQRPLHHQLPVRGLQGRRGQAPRRRGRDHRAEGRGRQRRLASPASRSGPRAHPDARRGRPGGHRLGQQRRGGRPTDGGRAGPGEPEGGGRSRRLQGAGPRQRDAEPEGVRDHRHPDHAQSAGQDHRIRAAERDHRLFGALGPHRRRRGACGQRGQHLQRRLGQCVGDRRRAGDGARAEGRAAA